MEEDVKREVCVPPIDHRRETPGGHCYFVNEDGENGEASLSISK